MTTPPENDDLLRSLGALGARDIDGWRGERIRTRAHHALAEAQRRARSPWLRGWYLTVDIALPGAAAVLSAAYLGWVAYCVATIL